jgi:S-adenosylmethionine:tRNA ribosyltransferase-isomerase
MFDLKQFHYELPERLIAQVPLSDRAASRLLVKDKSGKISHDFFAKIDQHFSAGDVLVINDSKVFPCRLLGKTAQGGAVEIFLLEELAASSAERSKWRALGKPMKKLKVGAGVFFDDVLRAEVTEHESAHKEQPTFLIEFILPPVEFKKWLQKFGYIPLPPYIHRKDPVQAPASEDTDRYQTVYAQSTGSVAAPTAGLHFTEELLQRLRNKGVVIAHVTLHVGAGTFLPIKTQDIDQHYMHSEKFSVPKSTLSAIEAAIERGSNVVAVGTTSLRTLESLYLEGKRNTEKMRGLCGQLLSTELFIKPQTHGEKYQPGLVNGLLTNFHQPESTLFILVCALCGILEAQAMYRAAIKEEYRFFSYGDACLFWL